jgi:4-hydroxybenzoate polyprenyltransferase
MAPTGTVPSLVRACHPGPSAVVTAIGAALGAGAGADPGRVALLAAALLSGQLSVGWSNDWLDAARDRSAGRTDKPTVSAGLEPRTLRLAAWTAAGVCLALSLALGPAAAMAHLLAVALAWSYNAGLKSTAWSWVPYAGAFGLLPAVAVLAVPGAGLPAGWLVVAGALLGTGAHVANVLPDLEDDAATGVRGLPHRLGRRASGVLAPALLLLGCAVAVLGPSVDLRAWQVVVAAVATTAAVGAGAVALHAPRSRAPFTLSMLTALACVALILGGAGGPGAVAAG